MRVGKYRLKSHVQRNEDFNLLCFEFIQKLASFSLIMQTFHSKLIAPTLYSGINVPPGEKEIFILFNNMVIPVVEFSKEGYKIRKVFA